MTDLVERVAKSGWMPIETAPDDGRKIIVYGGRYPEPEIVSADGGWWRSGRKEGLRAIPTHWQHLPEPPEAA